MARSAAFSRAWILARWPDADAASYQCRVQQLIESSASRARPIMLHNHLPTAMQVQRRVVGCHLSATAAATYSHRPIEKGLWLAVSCHDQAELEQACAIDADFVLLSAVRPTRSHPGRPALGWQGLRALCEHAQLPVLALGGVQPSDLALARRYGFRGVAGISSFWK